MSRLIIVCGLPGTGKTTLAKELSKKLKIFCLHKDSLKESLYDSLEMSTLEDSKKLGYPSVKAILDLAEENLARNIDVILESPFNFPEESALFKKWKNKYGVKIFSIILQLDESERKNRFVTRSRHQSHHDNERLRSYTESKCDYLHMPEKNIFITTDRPVGELVEEVTRQIN